MLTVLLRWLLTVVLVQIGGAASMLSALQMIVGACIDRSDRRNHEVLDPAEAGDASAHSGSSRVPVSDQHLGGPSRSSAAYSRLIDASASRGITT